METLGFGMPEENPVRCPGKKKKIEKYLVQEHIFRNHWHDKLSEALTLDEMAQKFDTVQEKRITKMQ